MYIWGIVATIKLGYHISHWAHYITIIVISYIISTFFHEIPNTNVFEWYYHPAPFLNQSIIGIPLYIVLGWYIMILLMLRLWIYFVLGKKQN